MATSSERGPVISCHTDKEWNEQVQKAVDTNKMIVVDFTATWCGPCRIMGPLFTELAATTPQLIFLKVDVDELQSVSAEWEVRAMPTFMFIKSRKQIDKIVGANKQELERKVAHFAAASASVTA